MDDGIVKNDNMAGYDGRMLVFRSLHQYFFLLRQSSLQYKSVYAFVHCVAQGSSFHLHSSHRLNRTVVKP